MPYTVNLCLIRNGILTVQLLDNDDLGRQVGPPIEVEAKVSNATRTAIDAQIAEAVEAQDDVIAEAKAIRQIDPTAPVVLVADLKVAK